VDIAGQTAQPGKESPPQHQKQPNEDNSTSNDEKKSAKILKIQHISQT
jgi:hypothetical protein